MRLALLFPLFSCDGGTLVEPQREPDVDVDADVDTDTGSDTDGGTLVSGDDYAVYYVAWPGPGIDQRYPASVTVDDDAMLAYTASADEAPTAGSCTVEDVGAYGTIGWGRWAGGTTGGTYYGNTFDFPADDGLHYAIVDGPATTGTFGVEGAWSSLGGTTVTLADGAGTGTSALEAYVTPGDPPSLALRLTVTAGANTWTAATAGWPDPAAATEIGWYNGAFFGDLPAEGGDCADPCTLTVRGRFAGDGAAAVLIFTGSSPLQPHGAAGFAPAE